MNLDTRARDAATSLHTAPSVDAEDGLRRLHRTHVRRRNGKAIAAVLAIAVGIGVGPVHLLRDRDRVQLPASPEQVISTMRNGRIVQVAPTGYWQGDTAPPWPGGAKSYAWDAFDQATGSFLFRSPTTQGRLWVVAEQGLVAEVNCPPSSRCGRNEMDAFGPDPKQITVPSADGRSVHVVGFDGTLRDTLDVSAVVRPGQKITDLAWSRDGSRLAVSTSSEPGSECGGNGALACVWIFTRNGGAPVPASSFAQSAALVYAEDQLTQIRDLAWSPDGRALAFLVAPGIFCSGVPAQTSPRLVGLRVTAKTPVGVETLNVYDEYGAAGKVCVAPDDYHVAFPFAWSPDGTRLAVTRGAGVNEISSVDGAVLAQRPGEGFEGPLAWLPERGGQP